MQLEFHHGLPGPAALIAAGSAVAGLDFFLYTIEARRVCGDATRPIAQPDRTDSGSRSRMLIEVAAAVQIGAVRQLQNWVNHAYCWNVETDRRRRPGGWNHDIGRSAGARGNDA